MKLIVDINLGKLTKWLRILGYDTKIYKDKEFLDYLDKDEFIICTKNYSVYESYKDRKNIIYIPYDDYEVQLFFLAKKGIITKTENFFKRCPLCNSELIDIEKEKIKDLVPPFIYKAHNQFKKCPNCNKIYWQATHTYQIKKKLNKIFEDKKPFNIGITAGDMNGIGPQIILKLYIKRKDLFRQNRIFIIGSREVFEFYIKYYKKFSKKLSKIELNIVKNSDKYDPQKLNLFDVGLRNKEKFAPGKPTEHSGELTFRILERSVKLFYANEIDLIVNTPNSKEALNLAGHKLTGATEFYSKGKKALMTFYSDEMIIALLTRHISISEVSKAITVDEILWALNILRSYGKIGVMGLNPHASEGGLIGDEENEIINPAIEKAKDAGIDAVGPLVSDTFFMGEKCNAYLSMYHDQLLPLFKRLYLKRSFQASLGLDIKRVSVSHGTAWDKVKDFSASCESLEFILDKGIKLVKWE